MHPCIRARLYTCIHARIHACVYAFMHASMHACIHASMHAYMHASLQKVVKIRQSTQNVVKHRKKTKKNTKNHKKSALGLILLIFVNLYENLGLRFFWKLEKKIQITLPKDPTWFIFSVWWVPPALMGIKDLSNVLTLSTIILRFERPSKRNEWFFQKCDTFVDSV